MTAAVVPGDAASVGDAGDTELEEVCQVAKAEFPDTRIATQGMELLL